MDEADLHTELEQQRGRESVSETETNSGYPQIAELNPLAIATKKQEAETARNKDLENEKRREVDEKDNKIMDDIVFKPTLGKSDDFNGKSENRECRQHSSVSSDSE